MRYILFCLLVLPVYGEEILTLFKSLNPKTQEIVDGLMLGELKTKGRKGSKRFYYYRYVTFYNVEVLETPIKNVFSMREDCHNEGDRFASWAFEVSISRTIESSLGFKLLGLEIQFGADVSKDISSTFEAWAHAQLGIKASHKPHIIHEVWSGETFKVKFYPKSNETIWDLENVEPFKMDYINSEFFVKRVNVEKC